MKLLIKKIDRCAECWHVHKEEHKGNVYFLGCDGTPEMRECRALGGLVKWWEMGFRRFNHEQFDSTDPRKEIPSWCPLPDEKEKKK